MEKTREFLSRDHSWRYDLVLLTLSVALHAVIWWFLKTHYSFVYSMSDDMLYRDMVSGVLYGKVTHNIIYQHWFSLVLSWLYSAVPMVEWCGMLTIFLNVVSGVTIYYCINKLAKTLPTLIMANGLYILFLLAYVRRLVFPTYTEIVGFLCAATILLYVTAQLRGTHDKKVYRISMLVCVLYAAIGYSWRSESFLMMVPFAVAAWSGLFVTGDKQRRIRSGVFAGILIAAIGGIIVENKIAYSMEPYDRVMDYYDAKVAMTDYNGIPIYSEHKDAYEECGISELAAAFMFSRAYPLAPDYTAEGYVQMGEYAASIKKDVDLSVMKDSFMQTFVFKNMGLLGSLAGCTLLLAVILALLCREKIAIFGLLFHLMAYAGVTAYLVYRGRIPDRIIVMAYMMMFWIAAMYVVHLMNHVAERGVLKKSVAGQLVFSIILGACIAGIGVTRVEPCKQELMEQQNLYRIFADRERGIYQYFADHEENFYLTTSFMWGTGGYIITEPEGLADNYAFINGYMIMIPEWAQKLEKNGIDVDHILDSAVENDKIHFILNWGSEGLVELMQGYLDEAHAGKQVVKVDEVIGFPVYNIQ